MASNPPAAQPPAGPPRFSNEFIAWAALVLLVLFVVVAGWFRSVWESAGLFTGQRAAQNAMAYVLVIVGLFFVLAALLFALVEATKPAAAPQAAPGDPPVTTGGADPAGLVTKLVETLSTQKRSTALLALGFTLLVLAAVGSGLINISVTSGGPSPSPTETPT